jgi:hypothetical protein
MDAKAMQMIAISPHEDLDHPVQLGRGWWDTSPFDKRNEQALLSAYVAVITVWATAFLLELV